MLNISHPTLTGHRIVRELGTVRGIVVRSRSVLGNLGAGLQTIFGGDANLYAELSECARRDANGRMGAHSGILGTNAITGLRHDAAGKMAGVTEVLCYGTAVIVEPVT